MPDQSASGRRSDFLQLDLDRAPSRGVTGWLTDELRRAVVDGRLPAGSRLPATRTLADDLRMSRGTVVEAYQRLVDEGLLAARTGAGTVVAGTPLGARPGAVREGTPPAARVPDWHPPRADLDLTPGLPDLTFFPRAAWLRAERAVLAELAAGDLGYGDPRGPLRLRSALAGWLAATRGVLADPEDVIVTSGVAQGLTLVADVLRRRGIDRVGFEDPGSRGARGALEHWGMRLAPVPVDDEGLVVTALDGLAAVVATPAHQFPTGAVLSPARRTALVDWAVRTDAVILEDDYDAEHRFDRAPVGAVQALAPEHVIHAGSASKTLAPGLRLGWLVAPRRLHAELVEAKYAADLGSAVLPQLVLARLIATGAYDAHVRQVRRRHRARRDALLRGLAAAPHEGRVVGAAAGLHLVLALPNRPDAPDDRTVAAALLADGIRVHPLSSHRIVPGPPGLVIGYAAHAPGILEDAGRRIARLVQG